MTLYSDSNTDLVPPATDQIPSPDATQASVRPADVIPSPYAIRVQLGEVVLHIEPGDLDNAATADLFLGQCGESPEPPVFIITPLLDWPYEDRWIFMQWLPGLGIDYRVRTAADNEYDNLFDGMLDLLTGPDDDEKCRRSLRAAIDAAVLTRSEDLDNSCTRIGERLRQLGVKGLRTKQIQKDAAAILHSIQEPVEKTALPLKKVIYNAPVPDNVLIPPNWDVSRAGIKRTGDENTEDTISAPILISKRVLNIIDKTEWVELTWYRDGIWKSMVVPRGWISSSRELVKLADYGLPVHENNKRILIQYLAEFEQVNLEIIPVSYVTHRLGWQGSDGCDGFLSGRKIRTDSAANVEEVEGDPVDDSVESAVEVASSPEIHYKGADEGDDQLVDAFRCKGTLGGWKTTLELLQGFPMAQLAVLASLCSPLLKILEAPNFVLSYDGRTKTGKTTALRVAASIWGVPDERSDPTLVHTWNATRAWIERAASIFTDHPLILDETKLAQNKEIIPAIIYELTGGHGKGRGSLGGTQRTGSWRTVLLTSGEAPITSFSRDGGIRARVLQVWGSPFGPNINEMAELLQAINRGVLANCGYAGPALVQYILDHRLQWDPWRRQYETIQQGYTQRAGNNPVAAHMSSYFATLDMTALLASQAVILPWSLEGLVDGLWDVLTTGTEEADQAAVALRYVVSWFNSHRNLFHRTSGGMYSSPPSYAEMAGQLKERSATGSEIGAEGYLGFFPHKLDEILQDGGFEPAAIRHLWKDRDWLIHNEGRATLKVRVNCSPQSLVAIKLSGIEEVEGPDIEPEVNNPRENRLLGGTSTRANEVIPPAGEAWTSSTTPSRPTTPEEGGGNPLPA